MARETKGEHLAIAAIVAVVVGIAAGLVIWKLAIAKGFAVVLAAGEGTKVWIAIAVAVLVFGSFAFRVTLRKLRA
jgi:choline-glycine betaine transporter